MKAVMEAYDFGPRGVKPGAPATFEVKEGI
jgi:hypothetical protein